MEQNRTGLFKTTHAVVLLCICVAAAAFGQTGPKVSTLTPPLFDFYSKLLNCNGIPIRSSNVVADSALVIAYSKMKMMLANIPRAKHNLVQWGAELHIIGRNQQTSDLPEFRLQKGVSYVDNMGVITNIDDRTRGMGGIYTSCGEENLLGLANDRYAGGQDICIHEFAHNIMTYGLDDTLNKAIKLQYQKAIGQGLWKDAYAAVNEGEYWAELSMWYFGKHGEFLKATRKPEAGPAGLKAYDEAGYQLLNEIYSGRRQSELMNVVAAKKVNEHSMSAPAGGAAYIMLKNNTAQKLKVFCVNTVGKLIEKEDMPPFNESIRQAVVGQVWRITTGKGKSSCTYQLNMQYAKIVIDKL